MNVSFATSAFAPVVLGFFGLGTGYLIYGPQELFGFPRRDPAVDRATGIWGIWMPGFCQLLTGVYIFVALAWFESFKDPALYTAGLAFSAYGIHWFALGWNRIQGNDARTNGYMSIPFIVISVLGLWVFYSVGAWPVGVLFTALAAIYVSELFASFRIGGRAAGEDGTGGSNPGERVLGLLHILTGIWLMYLTFATTLNISLHYHLPGG
ncbi:MAG TPA: hypothetical protein VFW65_01660 [Pseudonocardiaceae bacterium]|nr:hypothetical protein [Pseudonocardiaceae bacterium]